MSENEANLLSKARSGDVHAFNQLVLIHQETAYNIALRLLMGDTAQAADITQACRAQNRIGNRVQ